MVMDELDAGFPKDHGSPLVFSIYGSLFIRFPLSCEILDPRPKAL